MEKEKIMEKFKDYSKELEKILSDKPYSKTVKNLLLNMFYKIENAYDDYKKIKVDIPTKKVFLQELLDIIYKDCKNIELIEPKTENDVVEHKESTINNGRIITYQNELSILEQLYKLNSNKYNFVLPEEENSIALSSLLNNGEIIFKSEVIRDFDGWSWNPLESMEGDSIESFVYFGLVLLLGYDYLNRKKQISIDELEEALKEKYKDGLVDKMIKNILQISIVVYLRNHENAKEAFIIKKQNLENQFLLINEKKEYINSITEEKKQCIKECGKIDKYIDYDLLLKKEYIKQNEQLPQEKRVFSLSDFSEKVQKRREELKKRIEELTEILKPKNYVKEKNRIEKEYIFYNEIDFNNLTVDNFLNEFVKLLLNAFTETVNKEASKKCIADKIYSMRYLNLYKIDDITIGERFKKQVNKVQKNLITKACNLKAITIFSKDVEENYKIYKSIFKTRVIDLENLSIMITKDNRVIIYEDEAIDNKETINELKDITVKYNRKYKIFI